MRYAENPPKKYEDIVNVDFYAKDAKPALWIALRDVVAFWLKNGVKIFRVDNPHTKPLPFWEWLIAEMRAIDPDVIFLSEAFTRPKVMYRLAKIGFSQSYTYFTWRNTRSELETYLTELNAAPVRDFFRPHFFVNTPDINPYFLQTSGRAGFLIRAALATTLSGLWGMYSGFELCESAPIPGKEEYLDSEKYELRPRDWNAPGNITAEITRLNRIRRENPALHTHLGITFYNCTNSNIIYFGKSTAIARQRRARRDQSRSAQRAGSGYRNPAVGIRSRRQRHAHRRRPRRRQRLRLARKESAHPPRACESIPHLARAFGEGPLMDTRTKLDLLWYKDAVIYQLHVKSFFDSNDDGIGDFPGLTAKLDYIERLGVTTLWLLPFYPSPRRDDGYDIADYTDVHPDYGTMDDVRAFIDEAHARGIRVITELVINHTSDQHAWFQRARRAPAGSPERDFYVWSDTDQKYLDTRIIFLDTEKSNWTWDPVAECLFLASLLFAPARSEFRQSARAAGNPEGHGVLARSRHRRTSSRCRALPRRARRHQQREPARNAHDPETHPRRTRCEISRPHAARRSEPVAGRHAGIFRRRKTNATWRSTSR